MFNHPLVVLVQATCPVDFIFVRMLNPQPMNWRASGGGEPNKLRPLRDENTLE